LSAKVGMVSVVVVWLILVLALGQRAVSTLQVGVGLNLSEETKKCQDENISRCFPPEPRLLTLVWMGRDEKRLGRNQGRSKEA